MLEVWAPQEEVESGYVQRPLDNPLRTCGVPLPPRILFPVEGGMMLELTCPYCATVDEPYLGWQVFDNGAVHLRAECRSCGRYIKYLKQSEPDGSPSVWALMAPSRP